MNKLAYTIAEVVAVGGGSRTTVYDAINDGALKARKRGARTIILAPDLQEYLENLPDFHDRADENREAN